MANEFKHLSVGGELTQGEYEGVGAHVFDSQATGDIAYASSTTQLSRLGIGAENTTLQVSSGGIPEWVAAPTFSTGTVIGNLTLANGSITDSSGAISFGDENLTSTGVITGATVEATGDTSAGDNSALGYTSAEGAILTGQGSTSDVTIKNDADGTVISIPTGTTNVKLAESSDLMFGSNAILSDSSGTMTLSNVDALDATTEATIEGAIDTLANLTSASSLATVGTITSGTWQGTTVAVAQGGTGATTLNNLITLGTHTTGNYVTDITAGDLIDVSGGGSETATVTVSVDLSELTDMTGAEAGTDELVILDAGTQKRKAINEINLSSFNDDLGYAAGDITAVTAGTGLSGGGTSGAVTVNIDFSSLTDMTGAEAGTDELVILDAGTEKRKAINEINLSSFNDDLGYASGDITAVTAGVGLSGGGTSGAVSLALDLSELSDVTPANGDKLATIDSDGSTEQLTTVASLATLFAGTGLTASSSVIGVDASQAITALTGGDLTIYEDANNADVSLKLGTSATESLTIQVLNGASNKTAEEVHFSTATASGTADHGKMVFDVDGTDIVTIDDGGLNVTSGSLETATIDYTDGDNAITIADGGGVTFAQNATFSGIVDITDTTDASDTTGDTGALRTEGGASIAKKLYVGSDLDANNLKIAGAQGSDGQVLTSTGSGVAWEDASGGSSVDSQTFTSSGTWTKPAGVTFVFVEVMGGGGGGGSGDKDSTYYSAGGAGGAGGANDYRLFLASELSSTETVTIGAGGSGGASQTTNGMEGNNGSSGGSTIFKSSSILSGTGGGGGRGGETYSASGGTSSPDWGHSGGSGAAGDTNNGNTGGAGKFTGGGGAGGGQDADSGEHQGGTGGSAGGLAGGAGGAAGGSNGANATNAGSGGGGGGSRHSGGNGGNGGNGAAPGGGGGGGGIARNDQGNTGAGGNGANGRCRVWSW